MEVLNVGVGVGRHGIHNIYENYVHILLDVLNI